MTFIFQLIHCLIAVVLSVIAIVLTVKRPLSKNKSFYIWSSVAWIIYTVPIYNGILHTMRVIKSGKVCDTVSQSFRLMLFFVITTTLPYLLLVSILAFAKYCYEIRKGTRHCHIHPQKQLRLRRIAASVLLAVLLINTIWIASLQGTWLGDGGEGHRGWQLTVRGMAVDDCWFFSCIKFPGLVFSESLLKDPIGKVPRIGWILNYGYCIYLPTFNGKTFRLIEQTTPFYREVHRYSYTYTLVERDTTGWLLIPSLWLALAEIGIWVAAEVIHRKRKTGVSTDE